MKKITTLCASAALLSSWVAFAGPMPKIKKISGELAESFEGLHHFYMTQPDQGSCQETLNQETFKVWDCVSSEGATATLSNESAKSLSLQLPKAYKVFYIEKLDKTWSWEFRYLGVTGSEFAAHGIPGGTPSILTWTLSEEQPEKITTVWEIPSLGISRTFFAASEDKN